MGARYVNTDLVLRSRHDLAPLAAALEGRWAIALEVKPRPGGMWRAMLETAREFETPEATIERLLRSIEALDPEPRERWNACTSREFDLGYRVDLETPTLGTPTLETPLGPDLLRRIAEVGGALRITIYPADDPQSRDA